jgi:hypothetical protein
MNNQSRNTSSAHPNVNSRTATSVLSKKSRNDTVNRQTSNRSGREESVEEKE